LSQQLVGKPSYSTMDELEGDIIDVLAGDVITPVDDDLLDLACKLSAPDNLLPVTDASRSPLDLELILMRAREVVEC